MVDPSLSGQNAFEFLTLQTLPAESPINDLKPVLGLGIKF